MTVQTQEDRLLEKMRNTDFYRDKVFNKDGIVDHNKWEQQNKKILFILKETNDFADNNKYAGDLRAFLRDGAIGKLWNNVVRWSRAIQCADKDRDTLWNELDQISEKERIEGLRGIAVINIKKTPGGGESIWSEINDAAGENAAMLREQIKLISPDIIVCGGTGHFFRKLFGIEESAVVKTASNAVWYCTWENIPVFFHYHPSARKSAREMFDQLVCAIRHLERTTPC